MNEPHKDTDTTEVRKNAEKFVASAGLRWAEATVTTLVVVVALAALGRYLDTLWGISPWLFISGIVVSFPLSQFIIYKRLKKRFKL